MKKSQKIIFICIILFLIFIGIAYINKEKLFLPNKDFKVYDNDRNLIYDSEQKNEITNTNNINNYSNQNLYEYNYFNPSNENNYYYGDEFLFLNTIYYKLITDYQEYSKFKNYYPDIFEMSQSDFENNFMILTIVENESTKNLCFEQIDSDETTLYIGLNKKSQLEEVNIDRGLSIKIDKSLLREKIEVFKSIENIDFMNNYSSIKNLSKDYTKENAISDNCFVISTDSVSNLKIFDEFLNKISNNNDAEIRVANYNNYLVIYDIKYSSLEKKYYVCVDQSRVTAINYDSTIHNNHTYNYYKFDNFEKRDTTNINIVNNYKNINNYIFINNEFPETNLSFSFYN